MPTRAPFGRFFTTAAALLCATSAIAICVLAAAPPARASDFFGYGSGREITPAERANGFKDTALKYYENGEFGKAAIAFELAAKSGSEAGDRHFAAWATAMTKISRAKRYRQLAEEREQDGGRDRKDAFAEGQIAEIYEDAAKLLDDVEVVDGLPVDPSVLAQELRNSAEEIKNGAAAD